MYVDSCTSTINGKPYTRHLLRQSFRQGPQVKHRTIANLSHCSEAEIQALKLALRHKDNLAQLGSLQAVSLQQGASVGALWLLHQRARALGIEAVLGHSRQGKLALWQVLARILEQGSRLSAVRLASRHAVCDLLGLEAFNEDDLYRNLDWLAGRQQQIEQRLFERTYGEEKPQLYWYDVTSSYLEGQCNELAAFGYNRDGKRGKRQIVIGLLCDQQGRPLAVSVFAGNQQDLGTLSSQIQKVAHRFQAQQVTFVGDRGMIKGPQMEELAQYGFHYITAITKPQIRTLLQAEVIQIGLFDQQVAEVITPQGLRYVLRRNAQRAQQMRDSREDRLQALQLRLQDKNRYLRQHPRAQVQCALRELDQWRHKFKIKAWTSLAVASRRIEVQVDAAALRQESRLDGCYVIQTDLPQHSADKQVIHQRYKDLALVEQAYRCIKSGPLEIRPLYLRREGRTRGHAFVVMLAYLIIQDLTRHWQSLDVTVREGVRELSSLCLTDLYIEQQPRCSYVPRPRPLSAQLLKAAGVRLPKALPNRGVTVATRKKLPARRKNG